MSLLSSLLDGVAIIVDANANIVDAIAIDVDAIAIIAAPLLLPLCHSFFPTICVCWWWLSKNRLSVCLGHHWWDGSCQQLEPADGQLIFGQLVILYCQ